MTFAVDITALREPRLLVPGKQPLGPVKIDWSNPLTKQLGGLWLENNVHSIYHDLTGIHPRMLPASGILPVGRTINESNIGTAGGPIIGHQFAANTSHASAPSLYVPNANRRKITGGLAVLAIVFHRGFNLYNQGVIGNWRGVGVTWREWTLCVGPSSGGWAPGLQVSGTGSYDSNLDIVGSVANTDAKYHIIGGRYQPSTEIAVFNDGVKVGSKTTNIPAQLYQSGSAPLDIGYVYGNPAQNTTVYLYGDIAFVCFWNGTSLSDDIMVRLMKDPYQFLIPA